MSDASPRTTPPPELRLGRERPDSPAATSLIAALDAELGAVYPPDAMFGLHDDDLDERRMIFLVARSGERPVACGALRILDAEAGEPPAGEVKRMYVVPDLRGRGVAGGILSAIEACAAERRLEVLRLETGVHQHAAQALYRRHGFGEIPLYGEYVGGAFSVCFEKKL